MEGKNLQTHQLKPLDDSRLDTSHRTHQLNPPYDSFGFESTKINNFYSSYRGHSIRDLSVLFKALKSHDDVRNQRRSIIWLAGDSSLDNKFWFSDRAGAVNGYESVLSPPVSVQDIAYWLNVEAELHELPYVAINCAVEESTIGQRSCAQLLDQDKFISEHVDDNDVLVVSVGGNDIALKPTVCTIVNMLSLICCTTNSCVREMSCSLCALSCDDYLCGCSTSCCSNFCAFPQGIGYFVHLFHIRIQAYINNILSRRSARPKKILVCMIYFPDETATDSWADRVLSLLGYDSNPQKLQLIIKRIFELATLNIRVPGVQVVGVPLFTVLNGKISNDYSQRVEPSASGGKKMAKLIMDYVR